MAVNLLIKPWLPSTFATDFETNVTSKLPKDYALEVIPAAADLEKWNNFIAGLKGSLGNIELTLNPTLSTETFEAAFAPIRTALAEGFVTQETLDTMVFNLTAGLGLTIISNAANFSSVGAIIAGYVSSKFNEVNAGSLIANLLAQQLINEGATFKTSAEASGKAWSEAFLQKIQTDTQAQANGVFGGGYTLQISSFSFEDKAGFLENLQRATAVNLLVQPTLAEGFAANFEANIVAKLPNTLRLIVAPEALDFEKWATAITTLEEALGGINLPVKAEVSQTDFDNALASIREIVANSFANQETFDLMVFNLSAGFGLAVSQNTASFSASGDIIINALSSTFEKTDVGKALVDALISQLTAQEGGLRKSAEDSGQIWSDAFKTAISDATQGGSLGGDISLKISSLVLDSEAGVLQDFLKSLALSVTVTPIAGSSFLSDFEKNVAAYLPKSIAVDVIPNSLEAGQWTTFFTGLESVVANAKLTVSENSLTEALEGAFVGARTALTEGFLTQEALDTMVFNLSAGLGLTILANQDEFTPSGAKIAMFMVNKFNEMNVGAMLASSLATQLLQAEKSFQTSAENSGKVWGDAFLKMVQANVPIELVRILSDLVTPAVQQNINKNNDRGGSE